MRRVDSVPEILKIAKSGEGDALLSLVPELCNLYWKSVSKPMVREVVNFPVGQLVVTDLDYKLDRLIIEVLRGRFPGYEYLSEETYKPQTVVDKKKPTWVIDALDGTIAYFNKNISGYCTSVALVLGEEVRTALVFNPFELDVINAVVGEVFFAEKGRGTFLNGELIRSRDDDKLLGSAFLAMQQIRADKIPDSLILDRFWEELRRNRPCYKTHTSQVMAYAEAIVGRVDGAVMNHGAMQWDIAAALGLAREVEGIEMTDLLGKPLNPLERPNGVVVAPPKIHQEIVRLASQVLLI